MLSQDRLANLIVNLYNNYNQYKEFDKNKDGYFNNNELNQLFSKVDENSLIKNQIEVGNLDDIKEFFGVEVNGKGGSEKNVTNKPETSKIHSINDLDNIFDKEILEKIKDRDEYSTCIEKEDSYNDAITNLKNAKSTYELARVDLQKSKSALPGYYDTYKALSNATADKYKEKDEVGQKKVEKEKELEAKQNELKDKNENKVNEAYDNWKKASDYCKQHPEGGPQYQANAALAQQYYSEWANANNEIQSLKAEITTLQGEVTYLSTQTESLEKQATTLKNEANSAQKVYDQAKDEENQKEAEFRASVTELEQAQTKYDEAASAQEEALENLNNAVAEEEAQQASVNESSETTGDENQNEDSADDTTGDNSSSSYEYHFAINETDQNEAQDKYWASKEEDEDSWG